MSAHVLTERLCSDDLVNSVCEMVHRGNMSDVLAELEARPGLFEAVLTGPSYDPGAEGDEDAGFRPIHELVRMGHEVRVVHEDYIYWWTTVVHIDDAHFVLVHEYDDDVRYELVVEGFVENGVIKIERMNYKRNRPVFEASSVKEAGRITNHIPFQFVLEHHGIETVNIDYTHHSDRKWKDHRRVWQWFYDARYHRDLRIRASDGV